MYSFPPTDWCPHEVLCCAVNRGTSPPLQGALATFLTLNYVGEQTAENTPKPAVTAVTHPYLLSRPIHTTNATLGSGGSNGYASRFFIQTRKVFMGLVLPNAGIPQMPGLTCAAWLSPEWRGTAGTESDAKSVVVPFRVSAFPPPSFSFLPQRLV